jgi:hypothetical protein
MIDDEIPAHARTIRVGYRKDDWLDNSLERCRRRFVDLEKHASYVVVSYLIVMEVYAKRIEL